jgi:hypothetical protein
MIMGMPSCKAVDPYLDCLISRHIFLNPSQVAVDPTGSELVSGVLKDSHSTAHSRPEALNLSNNLRQSDLTYFLNLSIASFIEVLRSRSTRTECEPDTNKNIQKEPISGRHFASS